MNQIGIAACVVGGILICSIMFYFSLCIIWKTRVKMKDINYIYRYQAHGELYRIELKRSDLLSIVNRISKYLEDNQVIIGNTVHQDDEALVAAVELVGDIVDDIMDPEIDT